MSIQWFPGHMAVARKQLAASLAHVDLMLEVVDARLPGASRNPMLTQLRQVRQRPCLLVLNKADLADPQATTAWLHYFRQEAATQAVAICCHTPGDMARLPHWCRTLAPHRSGADKPLRVLIAGIPNVGKSTLMNTWAKRRVARVGDEPAITRQQQRLDLAGGISLFDTPGLMWPKITHAGDGWRLAASHAIGIHAVPEMEVVHALIAFLQRHYPQALPSRYRLAAEALMPESILSAIARQRGGLKRGGEADLEKAAHIVLTDYRSGALGRISLETPASRAQDLAVDGAAAILDGGVYNTPSA